MNVQGVQRIAEFMRNAGGEQRQRLDTFALDGIEGLLPRFGGIMQNQRNTRAARRLAIQRRGVEPEKSRARILHLEFVADDMLAALAVELGNFSPVEIGQNVRDRFAFRARLQPDEPRDGFVEVEDAPAFIHDEHAVLDGVEERFKKGAFAREPLDDGLQTLVVEPPDAVENFVEEGGFWRCQVRSVRCQVGRDRLCLKPPINALVLRACS